MSSTITATSTEVLVKLPLDIYRKGCYYKQLRRTAGIALYSVSYSPSGPVVGYDVFVVRPIPPWTLPNGIVTPAREGFPSDESYGRIAWSFFNISKATRKYNALLEKGGVNAA